ncbi:MAG: 50S ribosomal protein L22 [Patescibacteria group bacterium]|nr:50S ribosomal protein L22 [Patescibacteria group bacterium]MCL5432466.1 50S ribosomal protein L22 [Patescibacteria group bacterium]
METIATAKNVRLSPRKARQVAAAVKKLSVPAALDTLLVTSRKGVKPIAKVLKSAIANSKLKPEELRIKNILVDEGMKMKRRDFSHRPGKEGLIQKRASHITVILES